MRITPFPGLSVGVFYTYQSMCYTRSDNTETAEPYHTVDLRVEYHFKGYSIFTTWENLMDVEYMYGDGLPGPPQNWVLGISREF